jgi:thiol-disulfide isomerase/thioredoxin
MNHQLEISEESNNAEKAMDLMKSNEHNKFVMYYAPWCGHCKSFMPQWDKMCEDVTTEHPNLNVKLVKVDCDYVNGSEEEKLGHNPNVGMYPTLRVYRKQSNPEQSEDYKEEREPTSILNYLTRNFSSETTPKKKSLKKKNSKKNKKKASALGKKKKKSKRGKKGRKSGGAISIQTEIDNFLRYPTKNTCDLIERKSLTKAQKTKIVEKIEEKEKTGFDNFDQDQIDCLLTFKINNREM